MGGSREKGTQVALNGSQEITLLDGVINDLLQEGTIGFRKRNAGSPEPFLGVFRIKGEGISQVTEIGIEG